MQETDKSNTKKGIIFPRRKHKNRAPLLFLLPGLLIVGLVVLVPILFSFGISFFRYQLNMPGLGFKFFALKNYTYIFQDKEMIAAAIWTVEFTFIVVTVELILGMLFAILMNSRVLGRARNALRGVFLLPIMLSGVVTAWMWRLMFDASYGPVNHFLTLIGMDKVPWGAEVLTSRLMVIITDIWIATPFVMMILLAGMQSIPNDLLEAASIDGASSWQTFLHVVMPLLKFSIMVVVVTRTMDALRAFDNVYVLTGGGPGGSTSTLMFNIYRYAFNYFQMGRAAAMSFTFAAVIFIISYFYMRLLRRDAVN